jgi:hypothetical protein
MANFSQELVTVHVKLDFPLIIREKITSIFLYRFNLFELGGIHTPSTDSTYLNWVPSTHHPPLKQIKFNHTKLLLCKEDSTEHTKSRWHPSQRHSDSHQPWSPPSSKQSLIIKYIASISTNSIPRHDANLLNNQQASTIQSTNFITRDRVNRPEITVAACVPIKTWYSMIR